MSINVVDERPRLRLLLQLASRIDITNGKNPIKPSQGAIIRSMLYFPKECDGWMTMNEIITGKKDCENVFLKKLPSKYMPSGANFTGYIKELVKLGLVEEEWYEYPDERNRQHKKRRYRLIQSKEVVHILGYYFIKTNEVFDYTIPYIQAIKKTKEGQQRLLELVKNENEEKLMILELQQDMLKRQLDDIKKQIKQMEENR